MNKVYVICKDDGTGVPAGIYHNLSDALYASRSYNPDISEFIIGADWPSWVRSRHEIIQDSDAITKPNQEGETK
jgi:hypothetical protein